MQQIPVCTMLSQIATDSNFPFHALAATPILLGAIRSLSDVPIEIAVNTVFTAASRTSQSLACVSDPHMDKTLSCALYLFTLSGSGSGKTRALNRVMAPLYRFDAMRQEEYRRRLAEYRRCHKVWSVSLQALKKRLHNAINKDGNILAAESELSKHLQQEPEQPVAVDFIYSDVTRAPLLDGLERCPSTAVISDEPITLLENLISKNLGLFNKSWESGVYSLKRHNRETSNFTPILTLSLMSQPGIFLDYMKKHGDKSKESGFFSRILFAHVQPGHNSHYPAVQMSYRFGVTSQSENERAMQDFEAKVEQLLEEQSLSIHSGKVDPKVLKLDSQAITFWENKRNQWLSMAGPGMIWHSVHEMVFKANANALKIAGLLHCFSNQYNSQISEEIIESACCIMEWYLHQAASYFYQFTDEHRSNKEKELLHQWIISHFQKNGSAPFKKNILRQYAPNNLRNSDKLERLLDKLASEGKICCVRSTPTSAIYVSYAMPNGLIIAPPDMQPMSQFIILPPHPMASFIPG